MNDTPFEAFRFEHSRPDENALGGVLKLHVIAVAGSLEEAEALAGQIVPAEGLRLIDQGPEVRMAALAMHIREGEAKAL